MSRVYGSRCDRSRDVRGDARLIRAELAYLQRDGALPDDWTFSVRLHRFSGGRAIDVTGRSPRPVDAPAPDYYTAEARRAVATVRAVHEAYNWDGSDVLTDYFDVKFYGDVTAVGPPPR